jgi:hypothetical protein
MDAFAEGELAPHRACEIVAVRLLESAGIAVSRP